MEEKANIVRTSIRMDADLHRKLADYVHERRFGPDRTSIDAVVQEAVRVFLSGGSAQSTNHRESVRCPPHLVEIVRGVIDDLSDPVQYRQILREGIEAKMASRHGLKKVK